MEFRRFGAFSAMECLAKWSKGFFLSKTYLYPAMQVLTLSVALFCSFMNFQTWAQNNISWEPASEVAAPSYQNNFPRIAKDADGNPLISWSNNLDLFFTRWNGNGFEEPIKLNSNDHNIAGPGWMGPDIATHGDTIYAVYKQTPEGDTNKHVWCSSSFDGGQNFNLPVRVDFIGHNISRFPTVTTDVEGNPVVGFMKFENDFSEPRWVVVRSDDHGMSFGTDVLASDYSSAMAEACDCCPSTIVSSGNTVVMPYRDKNGNIRDTWVGVSTDGGQSFPNGMDVDEQKWAIATCPSSGPDAVIIGDELYTIFMSGASGSSRVSYSKSSISGMSTSGAIALDANTPTNLISQNYPRIDYHKEAMAMVWYQFSNGKQEVALQFTEDLNQGLNNVQEIVDTDFVNAVDVMLHEGNIWVIWEDEVSGTVKYRRGSYSSSLSSPSLVAEEEELQVIHGKESWLISSGRSQEPIHWQLFNVNAQLLSAGNTSFAKEGQRVEISYDFLPAGMYVLRIQQDKHPTSWKVQRP